MERISQDKQDADLIRQVMEYKGFAKWSRQIYMMLPTRDHEYAAPLNAVKQDFYIGPRKVILTDVTYLYYGPARTPVYL